MTTEEKKAAIRKAAILSYRIDTFLWGWCWCCVLNLATDYLMTGKLVHDSVWITLGLFVLNGVLAQHCGRKTRIPLDAPADK